MHRGASVCVWDQGGAGRGLQIDPPRFSQRLEQVPGHGAVSCRGGRRRGRRFD